MSLAVAMPMQLVNTSRAECELTNRLSKISDYLASGSEAGAYEMTEQKSDYLAERQKVLKSQRRYVQKMESLYGVLKVHIYLYRLPGIW